MPRYSAAALDRAAAAGPPRNEDSWFAVFWPDQQIAAAGDAARQNQFKAAQRQYKKMEAQRIADALAAAPAAYASSTALVVGGRSVIDSVQCEASTFSAHSMGLQSSAMGSVLCEASTSSAHDMGLQLAQLTAAPVDVVLETLNGLLRDQPNLLSEFNARMAPLGHVMDPTYLPRSLPLFQFGRRAATASSIIVTAPSKRTSISGAAAMQSQAFLDDIIKKLKYKELSSDLLQLVRRACALGGAHFGHVDDQGAPVLTHLYLNAEGGFRPPWDAHLAGRCWASTPTGPYVIQCYNGMRGLHNAPVKIDSGYEDPSFGKSVAMMKAGLSDTVLVCAARHGRLETIELLIEMHADMNQQGGYGETPLFAACLESQAGAVRILVEAGARLDFVHDMTGLNILDVAVRDFHGADRDRIAEWHFDLDPCGEQWGNRRPSVAILVEKGYAPPRGTVWQENSNPTPTQFHHETHEAKAQAQLAVVTYLLGPLDGIDWLDFCFSEGMDHNPLYEMLISNVDLVSSEARRKIVRQLCEYGFDPNIQIHCPADLCSWTPQPPDCSLLHVACLQARHCRDSEACRFDSRYCMVKLLLQGKGDPTIFNSHGESPIEFAQRRGVSALLCLLQRHTPNAPTYEVFEPGDAPPMLGQSAAQAVPGGVSFCQLAEIPGADFRTVPRSPANSDASHLAVLPDATPTVKEEVGGKRRATPMLYRAELIGVADRLKPLPESPALDASSAEQEVYKRVKRAAEKANQQIVARQEAKLLHCPSPCRFMR